MKYFLIAGEASGDLHAGRLIKAIRKNDDNASFAFFGGDCMEHAAGCRPITHYKEMAFMAFSEVLRHLPTILGNMKRAKKAIAEFRPDALILIDYPSFNLKIAKYAFNIGIPVYYYISPKVWAWKEWRVKSITKYVKKVFSILPFETEFFARHDYRVDYVGNPTANEIAEAMLTMPSKEEFFRANGLDNDRLTVALLPGSRLGEIRNNLPLMAEAASQFPNVQAIVAGAPNVDRSFYESVVPGMKIIYDAAYTLLAHSQAALVTSGTATLETAAIGTPQVVCYRANGSKLSYKLFEHILKVRFVSLPNLIADKEVVPELLLHLCNPDNIAAHLAPLLADSPERSAMLDGYKAVRHRLGSNDSAETAARQLIADLK